MYLACAENGQTFRELAGGAGVGTFGGSEDHTQILNANPGKLSWFQFCPTRHKEDLPFPEDLGLVIAHSGVLAEKTGAAMEQYNLASRRARLAVARYNEHFGTRHQLLREIVDEEGGREETMLAKARTALNGASNDASLDLIGRFLQFYQEDRQLIPQTARALATRNYPVLGGLIDRSHVLSRTYLRNIVPEIDELQRSARKLGAIASSGFGAGFGGSVYAVVPKAGQGDFVEKWRASYEAFFPERAAAAEFFPVAVSGRAGEVFAG
jgi:galactokinase